MSFVKVSPYFACWTASVFGEYLFGNCRHSLSLSVYLQSEKSVRGKNIRKYHNLDELEIAR